MQHLYIKEDVAKDNRSLEIGHKKKGEIKSRRRNRRKDGDEKHKEKEE